MIALLRGGGMPDISVRSVRRGGTTAMFVENLFVRLPTGPRGVSPATTGIQLGLPLDPPRCPAGKWDVDRAPTMVRNGDTWVLSVSDPPVPISSCPSGKRPAKGGPGWVEKRVSNPPPLAAG